jgi:phosphoribosylanthranilate isomerase
MQFDKTLHHSEMMIKVCGMREPQNIAHVAALTPMMMGFIFYDKSPRYVGNLDPEIVRSLPAYVTPVAIFVNKSVDNIVEICNRYGITTVQLHGNESPQTCKALADKGFTVFKATSLTTKSDVARLKAYEGIVTLFVFDTKGTGGAKGGTGMKWDWSLLDNYKLSTPYLLSGGIGVDDVDKVVAAMRPGMVGIDLNSRFETAPGVKDITLLTRFILSLRKFNEYEPTKIPFWKQAK